MISRTELSKRKPSIRVLKFRKNIDKIINENRRRMSVFDKNNKPSDFMTCLIGDIQESYSNIVFIAGRPRIGKTKLAVVLSELLSNFLYYEHWDAEKYFFHDGNKLIKSLDDEGYKIYVYDEAGAVGSGTNKREVAQKRAGIYDYILQTQGNLINIYFFVLPFAGDLTTDIRKYANWILTGESRGNFKIELIKKQEGRLFNKFLGFKSVFIEKLKFSGKEVPEKTWKYVDDKCNELKRRTRKEKIKEIENSDINTNDDILELCEDDIDD